MNHCVYSKVTTIKLDSPYSLKYACDLYKTKIQILRICAILKIKYENVNFDTENYLNLHNKCIIFQEV